MKIIIIGFNRFKALVELVNSIIEFAPETQIIISIDGGGGIYDDIENYRSNHWEGSSLNIISNSVNIGLFEHVLSVFEMVANDGNAVILEDDLIVAPKFFKYASEGLKYYDDDIKIAMLSLYSPEVNDVTGRGFSPMKAEYDEYFMQVPSSWGFALNKRMASNFLYWLRNEFNHLEDYHIPLAVQSWPNSSWKKLFYCFLVNTGSYVVYPYLGFTTNTGQKGTHVKSSSFRYMTNLDYGTDSVTMHRGRNWMEDGILYDCYGELILNKRFSDHINVPFEKVLVRLNSKIEHPLDETITHVASLTEPSNYTQILPVCVMPIEANFMYQRVCHSDINIYIMKIQDYKDSSLPILYDAYSYNSVSFNLRILLRLILNRLGF